MFKNKKIIKIYTQIIFVLIFLNSCVGSSSVGVFGSGVSVAFDPRTVGMQIDDSIMLKNLISRLTLAEKLKITKLAWETKGTRSVKSAITIKGETSFKSTAKDVLITSQIRTSLIFNKLIKATNYNIDTINGKTYIFGISMTNEEKKQVIKEAEEVYGVKKVIPSIILVENLSRNKS